MITRVKRWGNSLGLIVPAEVARSQNIRDGDYLEVEIRRRVPTPSELSGTWKFRRNLPELIREMKEGWDDLQVLLRLVGDSGQLVGSEDPSAFRTGERQNGLAQLDGSVRCAPPGRRPSAEGSRGGRIVRTRPDRLLPPGDSGRHGPEGAVASSKDTDFVCRRGELPSSSEETASVPDRRSGVQRAARRCFHSHLGKPLRRQMTLSRKPIPPDSTRRGVKLGDGSRKQPEGLRSIRSRG